MLLKYLLALLSINYCIVCEHVCFNNQENLNLHLSTKTPYRIVQNKNDKQITYEGCHPTKLWAMIRHGTRNPNHKALKLMKNKLIKIKEEIVNNNNSKLCENDINRFREWNIQIEDIDQNILLLEGVDEQTELAERMMNRFPSLLPDIYNNSLYKFKFTDTQRTIKSFEAFATGLFGRHNIHKIWHPEPIYADPILHFYKICPRWKAEVKKNNETMAEWLLWSKGEEMKKVIKNISEKIGINDLTFNDVNMMYKTCGFETASDKFTTSPWCTLFDAKSIKILDFLYDLKYYWKDGYGYELTYKHACPVFNDMLRHIDPESPEPPATFYFTHSGTILKVIAHLGMHKDDFVLTHKDFKKDRKWRAGKINSFASNIAVVMFSCASGPHVLVMNQERIVRLSGCPVDSDLCSLATLKTIFIDSIENCDFDNMCRLK